VIVQNGDGQMSNAVPITILGTLPFTRGDANRDGTLDVSDPLRVLLHLYAGQPAACEDALDADDSGAIELADAVGILDHLFQSGPAPREPYPAEGQDATPDPLGCDG